LTAVNQELIMTIKQYLASPVMVLGTLNIVMSVVGLIVIAFNTPLLLVIVTPVACIMIYLSVMVMIKEEKGC